MFNRDTDTEWEKFGKTDPFYGVITNDKYRTSKLTDETKEEFFKSGYEHIERVLKTIKKYIDPDYSVRRALDFGCGVGRLVIPLSEVAETVTGIDVSESMLHEAKKHCEARGIKNVHLAKSDDNLSSLAGRFNLIHSWIVFQHIPVKRGETIFENLIAKMEYGGVCVVHFTYAHAKNNIIRKLALIKRYLPLAPNIINAIRGNGFFAPVLEMNNYDLNKLFVLMQKANVCNFYAEFTDEGERGRDPLGIIVYFKKGRFETSGG